MANSFLYEIINEWQKIGVFDVILPFLLMFAIVFAILQKAKILGDKRNINAAVALVLALFLVQSKTVVAIVHNFLPNVALIIIVILMFLLVFGIFSGEHRALEGGWLYAAGIFAVIAIIWALSSNYVGWLENFLGIRFPELNMKLMISIALILVFVIILFAVTLGGGKKKQAQEQEQA